MKPPRLDARTLRYLAMQRPNIMTIVKEQLRQDMTRYLRKAEPWLVKLPIPVGTVLDIGGGIGFASLALAHRLKFKPKFYILDKNEVTETVWHGFSDDAAPCNNLEETARFLKLNGIEESNLSTSDIWPENFKFDLIISHLALGFHFPVSAYYANILDATHRETVVILDIRYGTDGMEMMWQDFELLWSRGEKKSTSTAWIRR